MTTCPHCGCNIDGLAFDVWLSALPADHGKSKPRSLEQLRRFFAMLRAMKAHWPEAAEFQPDDTEHLRKWALIKAGHRETTDVPVSWAEDQPGLTKLASLAIEAALKAAGAYAFIRPHPEGGLVRVFKAKSIAFDKLGQAEFNALNDAVETVYATETGLDPETVLREHERAA